MEKLTLLETEQYFSELLACSALEIHTEADGIYIPYMMNDALECFLFFPDALLTGTFLPEYQADTVPELESGSRNALIFRQQTPDGTSNIFTLWFTEGYRRLQCFRYDQIGHFWTKGAEHWRRLVYIIGTVYDKYTWMGDQICTEKEKALLPLMEFAPFRMYSPISESLDAYYQDSREGISCMEKLAKQAGDRRFVRMLRAYRCFSASFLSRFCFLEKWFRQILFRRLNSPASIGLYELIFQKVQEASLEYPERDYGERLNAQIRSLRSSVTHTLREQGFSGEYPLFQKENLQLHAMEEHPFTILEAKDFAFRIQFMESWTPGGDRRLHAGFFSGRGNRSRILTELP